MFASLFKVPPATGGVNKGNNGRPGQNPGPIHQPTPPPRKADEGVLDRHALAASWTEAAATARACAAPLWHLWARHRLNAPLTRRLSGLATELQSAWRDCYQEAERIRTELSGPRREPTTAEFQRAERAESWRRAAAIHRAHAYALEHQAGGLLSCVRDDLFVYLHRQARAAIERAQDAEQLALRILDGTE